MRIADWVGDEANDEWRVDAPPSPSLRAARDSEIPGVGESAVPRQDRENPKGQKNAAVIRLRPRLPPTLLRRDESARQIDPRYRRGRVGGGSLPTRSIDSIGLSLMISGRH